MKWCKLNHEQIKARVFDALKKNKNYADEIVLGVPASYLDSQVFSQDNTILKDAPFLKSLVQNPNHIGCHTLSSSESFFTGTHEIERDVITICAEDILKAEAGTCDGYVASGGTEANMQAIWIYRNFFITEYGANHDEIGILCSEDSHYSMDKSANILHIKINKVKTTDDKHKLTVGAIESAISEAQESGVKFFIVVANMMTTMFGSVDQVELYTQLLSEKKVPFKLHIDGAYGGFYYPFSNKENELNFANEHVSSVTLDAHKMAQAPYGTGIFLSRKGLMQYANTKEASYVKGEDSTIIGSRSGANAISIWMILSTYGPYGWMEKIFILQKRTDWLCNRLNEIGVAYYRNSFSNIVTIRSKHVTHQIAEKYGLVPDNHENPNWYKIVVMEHVEIEKIEPLLQELKSGN